MGTTGIPTTVRYVDNRNPDNSQLCAQKEPGKQSGMWTTEILTRGRYVDNRNPDNR
jgi:hypothetical protein